MANGDRKISHAVLSLSAGYCYISNKGILNYACHSLTIAELKGLQKIAIYFEKKRKEKEHFRFQVSSYSSQTNFRYIPIFLCYRE